jgi:quinol monooxygenase YgiN
VIVVASWTSVDAHDVAAAGPAAARFLDEVGGLAAGPPAVGFYERG